MCFFGDPDAKTATHAKKGTPMLKNDHAVFVYVNRAQTEQSLNPVHDRGLGSSQVFPQLLIVSVVFFFIEILPVHSIHNFKLSKPNP